MIKESTQEEDIIIVNTYAPKIEASQYIRQTLTDIKGEIDSNTITVGDFNTPLTPMDRSSKQKEFFFPFPANKEDEENCEHT